MTAAQPPPQGATEYSRAPCAAVLFDRDGTLIRDDGYTHEPEALRWQPGAIEAIQRSKAAGALTIVVTNQSGIARGYYSEDDMRRFHKHMNQELAQHGAHIDAFYHCPFHGEGVVPEFTHADHPDRKPNPGMLRRALIEWSLDPDSCFVVGDTALDVAAANAAGIRSFLVAPGELLATVERGLRRPRTPMRGGPVANLEHCAASARTWLYEHALPLWWERGFDRETRCFHERISLNGTPVTMSRRIRVQARQTFVYACAGNLGWGGPWREAVEAGLDVLLTRGIRADGGTRHSLDAAGRPSDERRDLYDLAFVVFALATGSQSLGGHPEAIDAAERLVEWAETHWTHPNGGFHEGDLLPVLPRRQNPHMHMFEALLALYEATGNRTQLDRAGRIAALVADRCFDTKHGALPEYYDDFLRRPPGDGSVIVEPGHQFEWYWLLKWWDRLGGCGMGEIAERMFVHGEVYGVSVGDSAIFDEVFLDGRIRTRSGRLWPHAERIKANVLRYERTLDVNAANAIANAFHMLMRFCDTPTRGVWYDRRSPDGLFTDQDAPASSFYHIMTAMVELLRLSPRASNALTVSELT